MLTWVAVFLTCYREREREKEKQMSVVVKVKLSTYGMYLQMCPWVPSQILIKTCKVIEFCSISGCFPSGTCNYLELNKTVSLGQIFSPTHKDLKCHSSFLKGPCIHDSYMIYSHPEWVEEARGVKCNMNALVTARQAADPIKRCPQSYLQQNTLQIIFFHINSKATNSNGDSGVDLAQPPCPIPTYGLTKQANA